MHGPQAPRIIAGLSRPRRCHALGLGWARPSAMSVAAMSCSVSRTGVIARPSSRCTRLLLMDACGSPASPSSNAYSGNRSCGAVGDGRVGEAQRGVLAKLQRSCR